MFSLFKKQFSPNMHTPFKCVSSYSFFSICFKKLIALFLIEGLMVALTFRAYVQWQDKKQSTSDAAPNEEPTA